jgi:outer membrane murein-binding lipoprotein Lpp
MHYTYVGSIETNTMKDTDADTQTDRSLGAALSSLSTSADGLSTNVTELQAAVDDLQQSTEQLSESQNVTYTTLSEASETISPRANVSSTPQSSPTGHSAAGD